MSGYQNKILTIAPPPADEVIARRITFAARVAEGKAAPRALEGIRLQINSIVAFLNATLRSVRGNQSIQQFLNNITGGNTRMVIELITGFCGSPNVNSKKIVSIEEKDGNYVVPLHEFSKHALLGEYAYYNPISSFVVSNIFDVGTPDPREHFLSSLLIAFLNSGAGVRDNDGFAQGTTILEEMMKNGFLEEQVRYHLRRLARKRLIETPYAHYREIDVPDRELPEQFHFRVTSIGIYHLLYWSGSFSFLDATSTDTPIFETAVREQVMNLAASFGTEDRYVKATVFRNYLQAQWQRANLTAAYYDFGSIVQSQSEGFEQVKDFINRGRSKRKGR